MPKYSMEFPAGRYLLGEPNAFFPVDKSSRPDWWMDKTDESLRNDYWWPWRQERIDEFGSPGLLFRMLAGRGTYRDQFGIDYETTQGIFALVPLAVVPQTIEPGDGDFDGRIINRSSPFTVSWEDGKVKIGSREIDGNRTSNPGDIFKAGYYVIADPVFLGYTAAELNLSDKNKSETDVYSDMYRPLETEHGPGALLRSGSHATAFLMPWGGGVPYMNGSGWYAMIPAAAARNKSSAKPFKAKDPNKWTWFPEQRHKFEEDFEVSNDFGILKFGHLIMHSFKHNCLHPEEIMMRSDKKVRKIIDDPNLPHIIFTGTTN